MTDAVSSAVQQGVISTQIEQVQSSNSYPPTETTESTQQAAQEPPPPPPPPPPESGRGTNLDTSA
jgi:hypothetical protein